MLHGVVRDKIDCHHRFIKLFMQMLHGGVREKIARHQFIKLFMQMLHGGVREIVIIDLLFIELFM
jgi:hypothetical protein